MRCMTIGFLLLAGLMAGQVNSAGRESDRPTMSLDVRVLGAKGDGITDDTAAIQAVADSIKASYSIVYQRGVYASSYPEVVFPAGVYRITRPIIWPNWILIRGLGKAVIRQTDPQADVFYIHWAYRVLVENLTFEGGRRSLKLWTCNADTTVLNVRSCTFLNSGDYAIECTMQTGANGAAVNTYRPNADGSFTLIEDEPGSVYTYNSTLLHIDRCTFRNCMRILHSNADGCMVENGDIETNPEMKGAAIVNAALMKLENIRGLARVRPGRDQRWIDHRFGNLVCRNLDLTADGEEGLCLIRNYPKFRSAYQTIHSSIVVENSRIRAAGCPENAVIFCQEVPNLIAVSNCRETSSRPVNLLGFAAAPEAAYFTPFPTPGLAYTLAPGSGRIVVNVPPAMEPFLRQPLPTKVEADFRHLGLAPPAVLDDFSELPDYPGKAGQLNAADFGAKGDGKADDTAALQKALDAAAARPGVELLIPGGIYKISRSLNAPGDLAIRGLGKAIISAPEKDAEDSLVVADARRLMISHCHFEGGRRALRITARKRARLLLRNCLFNMTEAAAVECLSGDGGITESPSARLRITDCLFIGCRQTLVANVDTLLDSTWISTCYGTPGEPAQETPVIVNRGRLRVMNVLGVPVGVTSRWIDNYSLLFTDFVRFGGEEGGRCAVQPRPTPGHRNVTWVQNGWLYGLYCGSISRTGCVHCRDIPDLMVLRNNTGIEDVNLPATVGLEAIRPRASLEPHLFFSGNTVPENVFYENGWTPQPRLRPDEVRPAGDPTLLYYRFEPEAPLADSSGNKRELETFTGQAEAAAPGLVPVVPRTGAANAGAATFNGTNQYTRLTAGVTPAGSFTLELLFRMDKPMSGIYVLAGIYHWNAGNKSYALTLNPERRNRLFAVVCADGVGAREVLAESHVPIEPGNVYYAVAVFYASTGDLELYLQNVSAAGPLVLSGIASFGKPAQVFQTRFPFDIATSASGSNLFPGRIDEVRLSGCALAPDEFLIVPK